MLYNSIKNNDCHPTEEFSGCSSATDPSPMRGEQRMALGEEWVWVVKPCGSDSQFVVHKLPLGEEWSVRVHTLWFTNCLWVKNGVWGCTLCDSDGQFMVHKLPVGEEWGVRVHTLWFWWSIYGSQIVFGRRMGGDGAHFVVLMVSLWFTNWNKKIWTEMAMQTELYNIAYVSAENDKDAKTCTYFDKLKAHKRLKSMLLLMRQYKTIILSNEKDVLFSAFRVFWPCLKCWQLTFLQIKIIYIFIFLNADSGLDDEHILKLIQDFRYYRGTGIQQPPVFFDI